MLPRDLRASHFSAYPPQARQLAVKNLALLQQLPVSFLAGLLRELIDYDYKFPVERARTDEELSILGELSVAQRADWFHSFSALALSAALEGSDWVSRPSQFLERESAFLWSTHQLDAFRNAAKAYGDRMQAARPEHSPGLRRLGIAVIGQGVGTAQEPLFRALRKQGTYFSNVKPENGLEALLAAAEARAVAHPVRYGHWYVEGGMSARATTGLVTVSYEALSPVRQNLLTFMQAQIAKPGMGPEELRTEIAQLLPAQLGLDSRDPVMDRFKVHLFTEGAGTQIFSTTFAQWTTREALRRAEPLTLLVRYAQRQRQRPMNELFANISAPSELDPAGSLIDADMAAYYHWVNQQRLRGAEESAFLVWWEGQRQAVIVAPTFPRGAQSDSALDLKSLVALATG